MFINSKTSAMPFGSYIMCKHLIFIRAIITSSIYYSLFKKRVYVIEEPMVLYYVIKLKKPRVFYRIHIFEITFLLFYIVFKINILFLYFIALLFFINETKNLIFKQTFKSRILQFILWKKEWSDTDFILTKNLNTETFLLKKTVSPN